MSDPAYSAVIITRAAEILQSSKTVSPIGSSSSEPVSQEQRCERLGRALDYAYLMDLVTDGVVLHDPI